MFMGRKNTAVSPVEFIQVLVDLSADLSSPAGRPQIYQICDAMQVAGSVDPSARLVQPEGVALAIVIISPIFLLFSILAVAARIYVRTAENVPSMEDYLLLGSLVSIFFYCLQFYHILGCLRSYGAWSGPRLVDCNMLSKPNLGLSISNPVTDILHTRNSDRHPCRHRRSRHGRRPPQCVDASPSDEVVHGLDPGIDMSSDWRFSNNPSA